MYKNYWSEQTGKCIAKFNVYKCSEHRFCIATKPTSYDERGLCPPITPILKLEKIKSKMKRLFIKNELKFLKKDVEKYEK